MTIEGYLHRTTGFVAYVTLDGYDMTMPSRLFADVPEGRRFRLTVERIPDLPVDEEAIRRDVEMRLSE